MKKARCMILHLTARRSDTSSILLIYAVTLGFVIKLYNKSSAVAEMGDRLATIDIRPKSGVGCCTFFGEGELGPHLTKCGLGRGLPPYQVAS